MIDRKLEDLINASIDGSLSPEDVGLLQQKLAADPSARAYHKELLQVDERLAAVPIVEPPARLKREVLRYLESRRETSAGTAEPSGGGTWLRALQAALQGRRRLGYAVSFGIGLALGLLLLSARPGVDPTKIDPRAFSGTMAMQTEAEDLALVDRMKIGAEGIEGELITRSADGAIVIELALVAERDAEISLEFDPDALLPRGIESTESTIQTMIRPGLVRVSHIGQNQYRVLFERTGGSAPELSFTIRSNDVVLTQKVSGIAGLQ